MKDYKVSVYPAKVHNYKNGYASNMKENRFKETIRIKAESGTYKSWKSTRYELPSIFVLKKHS